MKLLVIEWEAWTYNYIYKAFLNLGVQVDINKNKIGNLRPPKREDQEIAIASMSACIKNEHYDAVFSINFFAAIAEACHREGIVYISWAYDTPSLGEDVNTHYYDTNRIFVFDSKELKVSKLRGIQNVWKCDLAVNTDAMDLFINEGKNPKLYSSEISFVGRLYNTVAVKAFSKLPEYSVGYYNALINTQLGIHGNDLIAQILSNELIEYLDTPEFDEALKDYNKEMNTGTEEIKEPLVRILLQQTVTNKERKVLLAALAKHYQVNLFTTDSKDEAMKNVNFRAKVSYFFEMPLVFRNSKINLNITARNITKGIPQRCLDIMACKGLLLTNYQEDLFEELVENQDMLVYRDIAEAVEKCDYYLKHDVEAKRIRMNGYRKVKECFSYERQLAKILDLSGMKWR